jgi:2-dehydro-3-deoxyphosphooctonate aldolase (KDO 8-P synthase)
MKELLSVLKELDTLVKRSGFLEDNFSWPATCA